MAICFKDNRNALAAVMMKQLLTTINIFLRRRPLIKTFVAPVLNIVLLLSCAAINYLPTSQMIHASCDYSIGVSRHKKGHFWNAYIVVFENVHFEDLMKPLMINYNECEFVNPPNRHLFLLVICIVNTSIKISIKSSLHLSPHSYLPIQLSSLFINWISVLWK